MQSNCTSVFSAKDLLVQVLLLLHFLCFQITLIISNLFVACHSSGYPLSKGTNSILFYFQMFGARNYTNFIIKECHCQLLDYPLTAVIRHILSIPS